MARRASLSSSTSFRGLKKTELSVRNQLAALLNWQALEAQSHGIQVEGDRPPGERRDDAGRSSHHPMAALCRRGVRGANQRQTRWTLRLSCQ